MIESTEFTLPIKISVPWLTKAFFIFGIVLFLALGIAFEALLFVLFALLSVYAFILSHATVEIDQGAITLSTPPHGTYMIYWQDIEYVETNGILYVFIGKDKHLMVSLDYMNKGKREFLAFFKNFTHERQLIVKPLSSIRLKQKNTKVS